jgi:cobalt-zinc-cadmium efflux system outer membrane protein
MLALRSVLPTVSLLVTSILLILGGARSSWGQARPLPADLQAYISEALAAHPEIKRLAAQQRAAREASRAAGALDDPMLTFGFFNLPVNTFSFRQEDMTTKTVEISQKFPFPGKRRLRTEVAAAQAQTEALALLDKMNEIRGQVIQAYWGLSLAQAAEALTLQKKQFWEQVVKVAETRYATGQGQQTDVLQAQLELSNYLDRLLQWQQQQESWRASLNTLRDRPVTASVPPAAILAPQTTAPATEEMLTRLESRPQMQALQAQIQKQSKAVALARKDYWPDITIGVNYGFRENSPTMTRTDFFTSYVQINLPLWFRSKQAPRVREEQAKQEAAQNAYQAAWNQLAGTVRDQTNRLARLVQQIRLYQQGILPQAQQAAQAALAAYQVGNLDFARLVQTTLLGYEAELQYQEYLKEYEETWAALEILVGQEVPRQSGGK